jgi:hypothetical protein
MARHHGAHISDLSVGQRPVPYVQSEAAAAKEGRILTEVSLQCIQHPLPVTSAEGDKQTLPDTFDADSI